MHEPLRKELVSLAYLTAVAAAVQCEIMAPKFDIDSVDALILPRGGAKRLNFGVQMKATTKDCVTPEEVTFDLPIKNYHDLRLDQNSAPTLLVVLHLPPNEADWIKHGTDILSLKNNAYYLNLLDYPDSDNDTSVRIKIPSANRFTAASLNDIFAYLTTHKVLPK